MTVLAALICLVLFVCEASAFMYEKPSSRIVIDSNQDNALRINFDVQMLDMSCDHVTVGVWDAFGTARMNITQDVMKQRIDHKGSRKGHPYTEEELIELDLNVKRFTTEEKQELDSDWSSSSDHFKHSDFQSVIEAHDMTLVNFYADWCPHCRQFAPLWTTFEEKVNRGEDTAKDADGAAANVRVLKINCVDFEETCQGQQINAFPTVRLYRKSVKPNSWTEYQGPRQIAPISAFMHAEVAKRHMHVDAEYHDVFKEGCRLSGSLEVARVPGTVHFQAVPIFNHKESAEEKTLNLAFTNVSHLVHHLSFGEAPRRAMHSLPAEYKRAVNPIDGRSFVVDKFHKAPNHFIKVVHTRFEQSGVRSYQATHQWSTRTLPRDKVPQAKFSYDLSPVEVVVSAGERRWYDFLTQVLAIIGGAYTVMSMLTGIIKEGSEQVKHALGKHN